MADGGWPVGEQGLDSTLLAPRPGLHAHGGPGPEGKRGAGVGGTSFPSPGQLWL